MRTSPWPGRSWRSPRATTGDLVAIAKIKSQAHLLAIAGRAQLEFVTDALLAHGDRDVVHAVASNTAPAFPRARSRFAPARGKDESLAEGRVAARRSIAVVPQVVAAGTEAVRSRLLAAALPERQAEIRRMLSLISNDAGRAGPMTGGIRPDAISASSYI